MIKILKNAALMSATLLALVACGKSNQEPPKVEPEVVVDEGYLKTNFDSKVAKLEPNFMGNDWREFSNFHFKTKLEKVQSETTNEYNERRRKLWTQPIYAEVKGDGLLAVAAEVNTSYNADAGVLTISKKIQKMLWTDERIYYVFSQKTPPSIQQGQAAYGIQANVTSHDEFYFGVRPVNKSLKRIPVQNQAVKMKLSAEEAQTLAESNLKAVYIGKLAFPNFFDIDYRTTKPTLDNPNAKKSELDILVMKLEEVWLVNGKTGEVLSKKF